MAVTFVMVGEEEVLYTPRLAATPDTVAVTFVMIVEELSLVTP